MNIFQELIGHQQIREYIERVSEQNRLAHAYCFSGPEGIGKQFFAKTLASVLLQTSSDALDTHADFLHIARLWDEKKERFAHTITVEQIRGLRTHAQTSPMQGKKKIYLIEEADSMTVAAQNALLKVLEEPRGDTHFFLLTDQFTHLLPTIRSRVTQLQFRPMQREALCKALQAHVEKDIAHEIAGYAQGRPGRALRLIKNGELERFREQLTWGQDFIHRPVYEKIGIIESLVKSSSQQDLLYYMDIWRYILHTYLRASLDEIPLPNTLSSLPDRRPEQFAHALQVLEESESALRTFVNPKLALEHFSLAL